MSESMMEGGTIETGSPFATGPVAGRRSLGELRGGPESFMFLTEVQGPGSHEEFGLAFVDSLLPRLSEEDATAGAWVELGDERRYVIQGWAASNPEQTMQGELERLGWQAFTRVFTPLLGLPSSKQLVAVCQMPNNKHVVGNSKVVQCQQNHTFDDHKITRCVIDGSLLT